MRRLIFVLAALLVLDACVCVPRYAFQRALENQARVDKLRLGQTLAEVEAVMGRPPERRSTRLRFDGLSIEEWSYLTDYMRKMDTTITFVGGKVDEIGSASWEHD
jgi:hypothetical protein